MREQGAAYKYFPLLLVVAWQGMAISRLMVNRTLELFGFSGSFFFDLTSVLIYVGLFSSFAFGYHFIMHRTRVRNKQLTKKSVPLLKSIAFLSMLIYVVATLKGVKIPTAISSLIVSIHLFACIHTYYYTGLKKSLYILLLPAFLVPFLTGSKSGLLQLTFTALLIAKPQHIGKPAVCIIAISLITIPLAVAFRTELEGGDFSISLSGFMSVLNRFHGTELTLAVLTEQINLSHLRSEHREYALLSGIPNGLGVKPEHPGTALSQLFGYSNSFFVALGTVGGTLLLMPVEFSYFALFLTGSLLAILRRWAFMSSTTLGKTVFMYLFIEVFYISLEGSYFLIGLVISKALILLFVISLLLAIKRAIPARSTMSYKGLVEV